jgi:hypothetical protein
MVKVPNVMQGFYTNDGMRSDTFESCDYVQIMLKGSHAEDINASMLISKESCKKVLRYNWYLGKNLYPVTYDRTPEGRHPTLHKFLINDVPKGYVVDHINHDKLDNRLTNLRVCTAKENSYNTKRSTDKFKGVRKTAKGYNVCISKDGIKYELKDIETEIEAAKLYDILAEELFGEYAGKNFQ